ncbi:GEVED domain-containing protein [Vibrio sp. S9_S30]
MGNERRAPFQLNTSNMRVVMSYNSISSACGTFKDGEAEDYTVDIQ